MAKKGGAQSHLRARISYLHRAAAYLQSAHTALPRPDGSSENNNAGETTTTHDNNTPPRAPRTVPEIVDNDKILKEMQRAKENAAKVASLSLPRQYISQMRGVSLKTQLRLPVEVKRSFCKRCDILLVPNVTCVEEIQNASRDRKKPWADVRVVRCTACGTEKRFPQTDKRSKKLSERRKENKEVVKDQSGVS
ncbi:hypothetical protein VTN96DRAFT_9749 [Rasamsonia emersonii]|uniref:RNAse P Rpr2/Rpp21 subunit domain protein n=1 Tax=Rasamsonia emersonii (strain ATCC 16479 / CBS 393.64 / IMI 116815) TaxID=1408163 RepID=A0A0F4YF83_RASE3|nr:hypothetical protein T310_10121 [Rasamsonia emersonii CBS 393.64]KKA16293.1 hypothetical protein T310_10121 [Rasamsonia emersonii CBS 393.64]